MKVKPISRSIKATALTNPNPSFVSMVKAGANQKPWRAVKMDAAVPVETPEDDMKIKPTQKTAGSAVVAAVAPKGYGVMQFEFQKSEFADAAAVNAWMEAGGYSDYEVVETAKGFTIENTDARLLAGSVSKIDGFAKGVSAFVGKLATGEEGEEEQPVSAAETATKAAETIAAATAPVVDPAPRARAEGEAEPKPGEEQPVANPLDAPVNDPVAAVPADAPVVPEPTVEVPGVTDVPPAKPEGETLPGTDIPVEDNKAKAEDIVHRAQEMKTKGVYEAAALGSIISELGWIVYEADYSGLSDATIATIKAAATSLLDAFMQAAQDAADTLSTVFKTTEARKTAPVVAEAAPAAPVIETQPDIAAIVASAVREAIAPLDERVRTAETAATEASARAVTAERSLAERVEADNARGQTRKGAEDPLVQPSTDKAPKARSEASTTILRGLGSRHA